MQRSNVALTKWFAAIRLLLLAPAIKPQAAASKLGIKRTQTVAAMVKQIRAAMATKDASQQLAGLDQLYGGGGHTT